jgi:hypothetical protein
VGGIVGLLNSPAPNTPPPNFLPYKNKILNQNELSIENILFKYVYIWLSDRTEFWTLIAFIIGDHIGGWRWTGQSWDHFEIDIRKIDYFTFY